MQLRMLCEEGLTHMFHYEERILVAGAPSGPQYIGGAAGPLSSAARDVQSYIWRIRNEIKKDMFDSGGDRGSRAFDESRGLTPDPNRWTVIIEHLLPRLVVGEHGCELKLRRRIHSEIKFNTGSTFFQAAGLTPTAE